MKIIDLPDLTIALRGPVDADTNFIINSWINSFAEYNSTVPLKRFRSTERAKILLALQDAIITVACNPEEPSQIYGYAVYTYTPLNNELVLHYAFTKYPYRKCGIFKSILQNIYPAFKTSPLHIIRYTRIFPHISDKYLATYSPHLELL